MTKFEKNQINEARELLNTAWDNDKLDYDPAIIMAAHRILKALDLSPRKAKAVQS